MILGYIPPSPPPPSESVPALFQRQESPEQSMMIDSIRQPEEAQPDYAQKAQDLYKGVEDIGEGLGSLAEARNKGKQRDEENSGMTANKVVASGSAPGEDDGYDYNSGYGY